MLNSYIQNYMPFMQWCRSALWSFSSFLYPCFYQCFCNLDNNCLYLESIKLNKKKYLNKKFRYSLDTYVTHSRYGEYPADMGEGKMKNEKWEDLDLRTEAEAEKESRLEIDLREIKAFNSVGPIDDGKFSRCQGFGYVSDTGTMAKLPYPCIIGKHYSNIGILF